MEPVAAIGAAEPGAVAALGRRQRIGDLRGNLQKPTGLHPILGDDLRKRPSLHQLHGEEVGPVALLHRVDGDDIWVVERRYRPRLAPEPLQPLRTSGYPIGQYLQGHLAPELRILGAVHLPHPTFADFVDDVVVAEGATDEVSHCWGSLGDMVAQLQRA